MAIDFPNSPTNGQTHTVGSFTWQYDGEKWIAANGIALDGLTDVTAPTPSSGDFLKWDGSAWVNDAINLGTDTTGNYVANVSGGTGITVSHTPGEGSSASVALNATLDDLSNVNVPSPTDGYVLTYSSASSAWVAQAGGGGASLLDDLTDVDVGGAQINDLLAKGENGWIDVSPSSIAAEIDLTDLGDVAVSAQTLASGDYLYYNGQNWVNSAFSAYLGDLSDVNIPVQGLTSGDIIKHDGTEWVNSSPIGLQNWQTGEPGAGEMHDGPTVTNIIAPSPSLPIFADYVYFHRNDGGELTPGGYLPVSLNSYTQPGMGYYIYDYVKTFSGLSAPNRDDGYGLYASHVNGTSIGLTYPDAVNAEMARHFFYIKSDGSGPNAPVTVYGASVEMTVQPSTNFTGALSVSGIPVADVDAVRDNLVRFYMEVI